MARSANEVAPIVPALVSKVGESKGTDSETVREARAEVARFRMAAMPEHG